MKRMFTNYAGKVKFDNNQRFWAWDVNKEEFDESELELEVSEDGYKVDDLGLYIITDLGKVKWLD